MRRISFVALALMLGSGMPLQAQEATENSVSLSGFGTAGVVNKTGAPHWGLIRSTAQKGAEAELSATTDSRLGAQIDWNHSSGWEAAAQGVLLHRARGAFSGEAIEQAYVGYRPWANTRLRMGRVSPDMFLYSESRNVGYAFTWARPPTDFYAFAPVVAVDGLDVEQRWDTGSSSWRLRATTGTMRTSTTDGGRSHRPAKAHDILAIGLSREAGGLLLKLSYLHSRVNLDPGPDYAALRQGVDSLQKSPLPGVREAVTPLRDRLWTGGATSYLALATQYDSGPWTFVAEGSRLSIPRSTLDAYRAYASAAWRKDTVTYYALASRVKPREAALATPDVASSLAPVAGPAAARQAQMLAGYATYAANQLRFDQSTFGVGLRWDFASNAALKFQVDRFHVRQNGGAGWRNHDGHAAKGNLVSLLVDFVWGQ
ncbi:hypothetical protein [Paracidovorax citrulli]|uniref:hypothetical protein n=1 Tax=Paracidovorax citrulli TaxID=80869 RepID=UPI001F1074EE|nr:hypothetical protein [Paracidovorax citrulli]WIY30469.1 hypothetical protein QRO09_01710 [Paracidovorax citrulli]